MLDINDNIELQKYSGAGLFIVSAVYIPVEFVEAILDALISSIKTAQVCMIVTFS